ncbi:MAG: lipopolysaccharide heptosyltransferase II [Candidatus Edwardsbacteria bacterium]
MSIKKIVIRTPNWIGDAVLSTAFSRRVRQEFSGAHLTLIVHQRVREIFEGNPDMDTIIEYNPERDNFWSFTQSLRKEKFDLGFVLPFSFSSALMFALGRVKERIGYAAEGRGFLLTRRIPLPSNFRQHHLVKGYLDILTSPFFPPQLGEGKGGGRVTLVPPKRDEGEALRILKESSVDSNNLLIGMNPGATYGPAKRWFPQRYVELGKFLSSEEEEIRILVFGSSKEVILAKEIADGIGFGAVSLAGKTNLKTLAALIERCKVFITNDTGTMHLACAVDTPVVALFGSTTPLWTGPLGVKHSVIYKKTNCSPCFKRKCPYGHYNCFREITVPYVLQVVKQKLTINSETQHHRPQTKTKLT